MLPATSEASLGLSSCHSILFGAGVGQEALSVGTDLGMGAVRVYFVLTNEAHKLGSVILHCLPKLGIGLVKAHPWLLLSPAVSWQ